MEPKNTYEMGAEAYANHIADEYFDGDRAAYEAYKDQLDLIRQHWEPVHSHVVRRAAKKVAPGIKWEKVPKMEVLGVFRLCQEGARIDPAAFARSLSAELMEERAVVSQRWDAAAQTLAGLFK